MPPAAITGIAQASATCGTSEAVGISSKPLWPPASKPSATTASTPQLSRLPGMLHRRDRVDHEHAGLLQPWRIDLGTAGHDDGDAHALLDQHLDRAVAEHAISAAPDRHVDGERSGRRGADRLDLPAQPFAHLLRIGGSRLVARVRAEHAEPARHSTPPPRGARRSPSSSAPGRSASRCRACGRAV